MSDLCLILSRRRVLVAVGNHKRGPYDVTLEAPGYTNQRKVLLAFDRIGNTSLKWALDRRAYDYYNWFFYVHDSREALLLSYMGCGIKQLKVDVCYFDSEEKEQEEDEGVVYLLDEWFHRTAADERQVEESLGEYAEYHASLEILNIHIHPCLSIVYDYLVRGWEGFPHSRQQELLRMYTECLRWKSAPTLVMHLLRAFLQVLKRIVY